MELDQLMDRYQGLQHELSVAYDSRPWPSRRIDGIAEDLMATERAIAEAQAVDEQGGDHAPGIAHFGAISKATRRSGLLQN
jgi:hypothetical protein